MPKQNSSSGKELLGGVTKQDTATCAMLTVDALAAVALANKMARMVWAITAKGERYREPVVGQATLSSLGAEAYIASRRQWDHHITNLAPSMADSMEEIDAAMSRLGSKDGPHDPGFRLHVAE